MPGVWRPGAIRVEGGCTICRGAMEVTGDTDLAALVIAGGTSHGSSGGEQKDSGSTASAPAEAGNPASPAEQVAGAADGAAPEASGGSGEDGSGGKKEEANDETLWLVEEEIRKAETLLARNLLRREVEGGQGGASPTPREQEDVTEERRTTILREIAATVGDVSIAAALSAPISPTRSGLAANAGATPAPLTLGAADTAVDSGSQQSAVPTSPLVAGVDAATMATARSGLETAAADAVNRALEEALRGYGRGGVGATPAAAAASPAGQLYAAPAVVRTPGGYATTAAAASAARSAASLATPAPAAAEHVHSPEQAAQQAAVATASGLSSAKTARSATVEHGSEDRSQPGAPASVGSSATPGGNRYADKAERDALIARLLGERRERLAESDAAARATPSRSVETKAAIGSPHTGRAQSQVPALGAASAGLGHSSPAAKIRSPSTSGRPPRPRVGWAAATLDSAAKSQAETTTRLAGDTSGAAAGATPPTHQTQRMQESGTQKDGESSRVSRARGPTKAVSPKLGSARTGQPFGRSRLEKLRQEVEAKRMAECTFRPKINSYPSSKRQRKLTREERLEQLSKPRSEVIEDREQKRMQREIEEAKACTFKPKINPPPPGVSASARGVYSSGSGSDSEEKKSVPVEERLHREAARRVEERQRAQREREEQEIQAYPFRPSINPDTTAIVDMSQYKPIHERIGELQRVKNESLQRLRLDAERSNRDLTFQPRISEESDRLAQARMIETGEAPVEERLTMDAALTAKRRAERVEAWQATMAEAHTFAPQISHNTARIVAEMPEFSEDFVRRQEILEKRRAEARAQWEDEMRATTGEAVECTFRPDIGNAEHVLDKLRPERLGETREELLKRLAADDRIQIEARRQEISEEHYSRFKFKPVINEQSRKRGVALTIDEHVRNERNGAVKERAVAAAEAEFREKHTFQPTLVAATPDEEDIARYRLDVANPKALGEKVDRLQRQREAKLAETRRALEYQQLRGCTFAPSTNPAKPREPEGPVVVRGLGRFLELKEMSKRLDAERSEREAAAFDVKRSAMNASPFHLSEDPRREERRHRAIREAHEAELKECTFHPRTMEGTIRSLMRDAI